ncbi:MAG: riboflavin synthase [Capsulimonadales bacterium]|nr:riboflavin synthase [Capsulimonadales bacterium]
MFTGIIEVVGKVTGIERNGEGVELTISGGKIAEDISLGDSVAINGVCLTATRFEPPHITFEAVYETLRKTTLGQLRIGDSVNLERAVQVGGRLGGHIVQGHVDGTGIIASIRPIGNSYFIYVDAPPELMRYVVTKGSVAVDGISLTIAEAADRTFALSIIPHTWDHTSLREKHAGDTVNIETDILGKYVERMLGGYLAGADRAAERGGVTMDLLARAGYTPDTGGYGSYGVATAQREESERW